MHKDDVFISLISKLIVALIKCGYYSGVAFNQVNTVRIFYLYIKTLTIAITNRANAQDASDIAIV